MNIDQILTRFDTCDRESQELLGRAAITNPFCTPAFAEAMRTLGNEIWIIGLKRGLSGGSATLACVKRGRLSVGLEFPSLPVIAADNDFWQLVDHLSDQADVTDILADSFCSTPFELPRLRGELSRGTRLEFVLRLNSDHPTLLLSSNHKRNIKKAQMSGMTIRRTHDKLEHISDHISLMNQSAQRRKARGESVSMSADRREFRALIQNGAAELFQALIGSTVVSSALILLSPRTGYYQSAGTSAEGMVNGASHFLVHEIADILRNEGRDTFNLGGAEANSPLARFKLGFGSEILFLPSARCYVGPLWKKRLRTAIRIITADRRHLLDLLKVSSSRLLVYQLNTEDLVPTIASPVSGVRLEPLTEQELTQLLSPIEDPEFRARQLDRLRRFGRSYAFGVYVGETIVHISWMLPAVAVAHNQPVVLRLQDGEAEITACETVPGFRGRGLYVYAIKCLATIARNRGIRRIYMKASEANIASQRGISKAGLTLVGTVLIIRPPLLHSPVIRCSFACTSEI